MIRLLVKFVVLELKGGVEEKVLVGALVQATTDTNTKMETGIARTIATIKLRYFDISFLFIEDLPFFD